MKYLKRVKGITKKNKIRNEQIWEALKGLSILEFIERQLRWWEPTAIEK